MPDAPHASKDAAADRHGVSKVDPALIRAILKTRKAARMKNKMWIAYFGVISAFMCSFFLFVRWNAVYLTVRSEYEMYGVLIFLYIVFCTQASFLVSPALLNQPADSADASKELKTRVPGFLFVFAIYLVLVRYNQGVSVVIPSFVPAQYIILTQYAMSRAALHAPKDSMIIFSSVIMNLRRHVGVYATCMLYIGSILMFFSLLSTMGHLSVLLFPSRFCSLYFFVSLAYIFWLFYIFCIFYRVYHTASIYFQLTSPSNNFLGRNAFDSYGVPFRMLGAIVRLGLMVMFFRLLDVLSLCVCYRWWNMHLRVFVEDVFAFFRPELASLKKAGIDSLIPFMALFNASPSEALELFNQSVDLNEADNGRMMRHKSYGAPPMVSSLLFAGTVLVPILLLLSVDTPTPWGIVWRVAVLLSAASIEFPSLPYLYSDSIHKTIILCSSEPFAMEAPIIDDYVEDTTGF